MERVDMLKMPVKMVMTTSLFIAKPNTILKEVNHIMERENIHHVPVVDETNEFKGIISKSDIHILMDWGTKKDLPESKRKNNFLLTSNLARDLMTTSVIGVDPEDTVEKCVQLFRENYFHAIPVVDRRGILVGLVTTYDLLMLAYYPQFALNIS
jgi:CBS domain-containing protein